MAYSFARCAAVCLASLVAGCASAIPTNPARQVAQLPGSADSHRDVGARPRAIATPALITVTYNGILKYFPATPEGGRKPQTIAKIAGLRSASSMAANGHVMAILRQAPTGVVLYNAATKAKRVLSDPYGVPADLAIDKNATLYVLNRATSADNVTMYRARSSQAVELTCKYLDNGVAIAADNEGDVFVNASGPNFKGVVEFPNGPNGPQSGNCKKLKLQPELGYVAGLAVDPKTDALVVLDNPGYCSGGIEGQMTIYPKPYKPSSGRSVDLNGHCVGLMRLDATSSTVFAFDRLSASGHAVVIARNYPDGGGSATYRHNYIAGFTTLPNTLPN